MLLKTKVRINSSLKLNSVQFEPFIFHCTKMHTKLTICHFLIHTILLVSKSYELYTSSNCILYIYISQGTSMLRKLTIWRCYLRQHAISHAMIHADFPKRQLTEKPWERCLGLLRHMTTLEQLKESQTCMINQDLLLNYLLSQFFFQ